MSPRPDGSPFSPDHPRLVCCNDFKGGSKARCSSSTDSSSVAISSTKNVTEYHAVALVSTRRVTLNSVGSLPGQAGLSGDLSDAHGLLPSMARTLTNCSRVKLAFLPDIG